MVTVRNARKPWRPRRTKTSPARARTRSRMKAGSSVFTSNVSCSPTDFGSHSFETVLSETPWALAWRSEEHTSELQSQSNLVCRLLLEKKKKQHDELLLLAVIRPNLPLSTVARVT